MNKRIIKDFDNQIFETLENIQTKFKEYKDLIDSGLHNLSKEEFDELKENINTYFNIELAFFSDTYPTNLFRVTNNKYIVGEGKRLTKISQLIGPPEGLAKMGRCNLEGESVFYAALDFETAIWETQPEIGDNITVSVWKIKKGEKLDMHHIFHPIKTNLSKESAAAYKASIKALPTIFGKIRNNNPELFDIVDMYYSFLTEEFMRKVNYEEKENYLVSALFSSRFLQSKRDDNGFKIEAISYPSVKREYGITNVAIQNSLVLEKLELEKIILYEIGETNYTKEAKPNDLIKVIGWQLEFDDFDFENDLIIYDGHKEIEQVASQHMKMMDEI